MSFGRKDARPKFRPTKGKKNIFAIFQNNALPEPTQTKLPAVLPVLGNF